MRDKLPVRPFELDPSSNPALQLIEPDIPEVASQKIEILEPEDAPARGWRRWRWPALAVGILGLMALQTYIYVSALIQTQPVIGLLFAGFLALAAISIFGFVWREFNDLRLINQRAHLREQAVRLSNSELHDQSRQLIAQLNRHLSTSAYSKQAIAEYRGKTNEHLSDRETLALYERVVMAPLDKRAYRIAMESSRDIGLLTALSPLGLLDGLLVMWRTTLMIRQIARLYGLTLGPTATFNLLRSCVRNATIAGVADMVSHAALEHVGASITALLSARAGQGAGNALLSARLSVEAIRQARPLPYITLEPPRLKQIREAIFEDKTATTKHR